MSRSKSVISEVDTRPRPEIFPIVTSTSSKIFVSRSEESTLLLYGTVVEESVMISPVYIIILYPKVLAVIALHEGL